MGKDIKQAAKKRNIVLVGSMGTGKSHIGRLLARELGWRFVDTDRFLERRQGIPFAEIGRRVGPAELAQLEQAVIEQVRRYSAAVIAVGGNFVLSEETFAKLHEHGVVVLLYAQDFRLVERVSRTRGKRPTVDYDDLPAFVATMNKAWRPWQGRSDYLINTTFRSPARIARRLARELGQLGTGGRPRGGKGNGYGKKSGRTHQWRRRAGHERGDTSRRAGGDL